MGILSIVDTESTAHYSLSRHRSFLTLHLRKSTLTVSSSYRECNMVATAVAKAKVRSASGAKSASTPTTYELLCKCFREEIVKPTSRYTGVSRVALVNRVKNVKGAVPAKAIVAKAMAKMIAEGLVAVHPKHSASFKKGEKFDALTKPKKPVVKKAVAKPKKPAAKKKTATTKKKPTSAAKKPKAATKTKSAAKKPASKKS